ncbi:MULTISPECIES: SCO1860 family LAETG-anchored protein [Streptomyces]|uniref:LPXTG cell wall anchor domain-containing protein n=1 Tax=Streptomyces cyaneofuscatus TaxID=66883 RepID=A0ABZ1ES45_9ACTN|nr:SCO1860 family LAETG-anchored protein [Streptomyces cyaneofuscatus]WSB06957.1 LPXTG cell wall anchor domain-containing protein [Streptomyces cyaneofuscatus]WSD49508.1 LPXTG cell wall anchor domain-containing protein [Streptomyces cyaneofuscatus]
MNSNTFRLAALAVAAAPVVLFAAVPAQAAPATPATGGEGKASAVVLRTGLDVSLLNKSVQVPLKVTLNEVQAPASAEKTALSVNLDGVEGGKPVSVLRADVATANATVDEHKAEGYTNLAKARVHVPGLPLLSLIEVEKVTSKALCEVGKQPVAESNVLGHVSVLGKKVTLSAGGPTRVAVPGVGEVSLDLSKTETTSRTAAATALQLKVSVNPLDLNVAEVEGDVTLAEATCETPKEPKTPEKPGGSTGGSTGGDTSGGSDGGSTGGDQGDGSTDVKPQTGSDTGKAPTTANLAETGGSSSTPYIAGGAALLLAIGAGATVVARRRSGGSQA